MKMFTVLLSLTLSMSAMAENFDFSKYDKARQEIESEKLRWKIEIQGELLVFNKNGTRLLYKSDEDRKWKFGNEKPITSYWNVDRKGLPSSSLFHEWQLTPQGELQLKIKQYESMSKNGAGEVKTGKLIQEKDFTIENMLVPAIVLHQDDNQRIIAQFKVQIWNDEEAEDIGKLAINSNRMTVYDNKGNLWATRIDNSSGNNVYFGVKTHLGAFYISYLPFDGAKKIGFAEKNRIRIEQNGIRLVIESADMLLPRGVQANVYGYIDTNKRTERFSSVMSNGSDKESNFLEAIKR